MAQYQQGTITLTAGETTVSGFGTAWLANAKAGDMLLVGDYGPAAFVGSVVSDTELLLEKACKSSLLALHEAQNMTQDHLCLF